MSIQHSPSFPSPESLNAAYPQLAALRDLSSLSRTNNEVQRLVLADESVVLKVYQGIDRRSLEWEHGLQQWLAGEGPSFAVPNPLPNSRGETATESAGKLVVLYPFIEGRRLNYDNPDDTDLLAAAAAELQRLLKPCPLGDRPGAALFKDPAEFAAQCCSPFELTAECLGVSPARQVRRLLAFWNSCGAALHSIYVGRCRSLPRQLCHNDITSGNVVSLSGSIAAVLDFEFACAAPRVLDVAMGLRMTMQTWRRPAPGRSFDATPLLTGPPGRRSCRLMSLTVSPL